MTTSTDRQTFRALVADVAARATAILPQAVNGRVEAAVKLVLVQDIEPQADGSILVGSSTDPLKTYRLVGTTCECQDFTRGQAPEGWCQHRIAAGIQKRVGELLAQEGQDATSAPQTAVDTAAAGTSGALPEAPASVNCHITVAGRQVQLTLRDSDEVRLLGRLEEVLQRYPVAQQAPSQSLARGKDWCPIHNVQMRQTTKEGRSWFSHKVDGRWCKGR